MRFCGMEVWVWGCVWNRDEKWRYGNEFVWNGSMRVR